MRWSSRRTSSLAVGQILLILPLITCASWVRGDSIKGFAAGSYTLNTNTTGSPVPVVSNDTLILTNENYYQASSFFFNTPSNISSFQAKFDYLSTGSKDGLAFVLQTDPAGAKALGDQGSGLGYTGISPSAAVEIHVTDGTNFQTNGVTGTYNSVAPIVLNSGDPIQVALNYTKGSLTETLTDSVTGSTAHFSYNVDLASVLGKSTAYVGFTAGTSAETSTQLIRNFSFTETQTPEPSTLAVFFVTGVLLAHRRFSKSKARP